MKFADLGKCTLRGIRKCPKCGCVNGTKRAVCKNKLCNGVFNDSKSKLMEVKKLITGPSPQVFSVCINDDNGEQYGFVQLHPVFDRKDTESSASSPLCLVSSCQQSFYSILKCHKKEETQNEIISCKHIQAAIKCNTNAVPISIHPQIICKLCNEKNIAQELTSLLSNFNVPLVQRVSKNTFVIRCKTTSENLLGYLHFTIWADEENLHYSCQCSEFKYNIKHKDVIISRCIHYYACICALKSHSQLWKEFAHLSAYAECLPLINITPIDDKKTDLTDQSIELLSLLENSSSQIRLQLMDNIDDKAFVSMNDDLQHLQWLQDSDTRLMITDENSFLKFNKYFNGNVSSRNNIAADPFIMASFNADKKRKSKNYIMKPMTENMFKRKCDDKSNKSDTNKGKDKVDTSESRITQIAPKSSHCTVAINFDEWLASIAERINRQMHYTLSGNAQTLVFHVQQVFFDCLFERISSSSNEKFLPDSVPIAFTYTDSMPLGTFTKFTWNITDILHIKKIFDNPLLPLSMMRSFLLKDDGTYCDYYEKNSKPCINFSNKFVLRPKEVRTFLRIGKLHPEQVEPTPFIIEWVPNVLPITKIGIMKIIFEYGHQPPLIK